VQAVDVLLELELALHQGPATARPRARLRHLVLAAHPQQPEHLAEFGAASICASSIARRWPSPIMSQRAASLAACIR